MSFVRKLPLLFHSPVPLSLYRLSTDTLFTSTSRLLKARVLLHTEASNSPARNFLSGRFFLSPFMFGSSGTRHLLVAHLLAGRWEVRGYI